MASRLQLFTVKPEYQRLVGGELLLDEVIQVKHGRAFLFLVHQLDGVDGACYGLFETQRENVLIPDCLVLQIRPPHLLGLNRCVFHHRRFGVVNDLEKFIFNFVFVGHLAEFDGVVDDQFEFVIDVVQIDVLEVRQDLGG